MANRKNWTDQVVARYNEMIDSIGVAFLHNQGFHGNTLPPDFRDPWRTGFMTGARYALAYHRQARRIERIMFVQAEEAGPDASDRRGRYSRGRG